MSGLLSRDQILEAQDLPTRDVEVAEWGGTVRLRGLTGSELDAYQASMRKFRGDKQIITLNDVRSRLVASCIIGEDGERLFTDKQVKELGGKSGKVLDRLFDIAASLSGLTEEAVEELVENFENGPNAEDGSD